MIGLPAQPPGFAAAQREYDNRLPDEETAFENWRNNTLFFDALTQSQIEDLLEMLYCGAGESAVKKFDDFYAENWKKMQRDAEEDRIDEPDFWL